MMNGMDILLIEDNPEDVEITLRAIKTLRGVAQQLAEPEHGA